MSRASCATGAICMIRVELVAAPKQASAPSRLYLQDDTAFTYLPYSGLQSIYCFYQVL